MDPGFAGEGERTETAEGAILKKWQEKTETIDLLVI